MAEFGQINDDITVYTHQVVREDEFSLYGFPTKSTRQLFNILLGVSGIGPKVATQVLGTLHPDQFAMAILSEDIKTITTVKGIGKKGAERLILELRDKFKGLSFTDTATSKVAVASSTSPGDPRTEVLSALIVLGFTNAEALQLVKKTYSEAESLQENIRLALKAVGR